VRDLDPLPTRVDRLLGSIVVACAAGVVVLGARVHHHDGPLHADLRATAAVGAHLWGIPIVPDRLARVYQDLGRLPVVALLAVAAVVIALKLGDLVMVGTITVGVPVALVLAERVGKPLVARPEFNSYSFPSGHTTAAAALATVAALLVYRRRGVHALVRVAPVTALGPIAMVLVVVRVQAHYLTDAVAGVLLGAGTVLAVVVAISACTRVITARESVLRRG
jgi:membrane-associated phospholipid phosphatase